MLVCLKKNDFVFKVNEPKILSYLFIKIVFKYYAFQNIAIIPTNFIREIIIIILVVYCIVMYTNVLYVNTRVELKK